ncbi:MAG: DUF4388 domain-containing protein [Myxococcota bacterium]
MSAGVVLMVEPNPAMLIVARNVLTRAGYRVCAVPHVHEAIRVSREQNVAAVLIDAPQADLASVSALNAQQRLPIILTFERGRAMGPQTDTDATQPSIASADFIEKPFSSEQLLRTVRRVVDSWAEFTPEPTARVQTLPAARDDDFAEAEKTDIFPFAHLLQVDRSQPVARGRGATDTRAGRLAEHLRSFLEIEGLSAPPPLVSACVRACTAAMAEIEKQKASAMGKRPAIEGTIPQLSIDQVLQLALAVPQPARCRVEQDGAHVDVFYENGNIVFARAKGLPDGFMLGQLLVAEGKVRPNALMKALSASVDGLRLGERLQRWGELTEADLVAGLRLQTEELVYEGIRWSSGRFMIFANEPLPPEARTADQALIVPHLLLEGMRRLDEWRRMLPVVGEFEAVLERREASSATLSQLSTENREILRFIDGRRTVAELVNSIAQPTFRVYRSLHALMERSLIVLSPR